MWLINKAFNKEFEDANKVFRQNYPGIDYIDRRNKVVMQVTGNNKKEKFRDSIEKIPSYLVEDGYNDFHFFINSPNGRVEYTHPKFNVKVFDIRDLISYLCILEIKDRDKVIEYIKENFSNWIPSNSSELFIPRLASFKRNQSLFNKFIKINKLNINCKPTDSEIKRLREQCESDLYHLQKTLSELSTLQRNFICMIYQFAFINSKFMNKNVSKEIRLDLAQYATHFTQEEAERFDDIYYGLHKWGICKIQNVYDHDLSDLDEGVMMHHPELILNWYNADVDYDVFRAIGNFYMSRYDEKELFRAIRNNDFGLIY